VFLLAFAGVANAATLSQDTPNHFVYTANAGDINSVTVYYTGTDTFELIDDGAATIDVSGSGGRCSVPDPGNFPNDATCTGTVSGLQADLGDQSDYIDAIGVTTTSTPITANLGAGNDGANGGASADVLNGDAGADYLDGGDGADTLNGGDGFDELDDTSGTAVDTMSGGNDDDFFYLGSLANGNDSLDGGAGEDEVDYEDRGGQVIANLTTGTGGQTGAGETDTLLNFEDLDGSATAANTLTGTDGPNRIFGGNQSDSETGMGGNDLLYGGDSNDTLNAGAGADELDGGNGSDTLNGDDDADYLIGGDNGDTLNGGNGDDEIDPGTHYTGPTPGSDGDDAIDGGAGTDWLDYFDRTAPLTINLSGSGDGSTSTSNNGQLGEHDSIKNIENVNAGEGADTITGNSLSNTVYDGGGPGDNISTLGGDDEIDARDNQVDSADCGDGNDRAYVDVAGQFSGSVSDNVAGCEAINSDYVPPQPVNNTPPPTTNTTPPVTNTTPPVTNTTPPAPTYTNGAFVALLQQSPKANKVFGSATVASDGSSLLVEVFNGKPSKKTLAGKVSKKDLKAGTVPFTVSLNKKASKAALRKKKGIKMTVRVTIKPASGKAFVKTFKVTVKKGKAPAACFRVASVRAHAAC
jgi:hypothetical protein